MNISNTWKNEEHCPNTNQAQTEKKTHQSIWMIIKRLGVVERELCTPFFGKDNALDLWHVYHTMKRVEGKSKRSKPKRPEYRNSMEWIGKQGRQLNEDRSSKHHQKCTTACQFTDFICDKCESIRKSNGIWQ